MCVKSDFKWCIYLSKSLFSYLYKCIAFDMLCTEIKYKMFSLTISQNTPR